ncbi:hypothetical protein ACA910_010528 [Epithemia clementina (nom. ined.)]
MRRTRSVLGFSTRWKRQFYISGTLLAFLVLLWYATSVFVTNNEEVENRLAQELFRVGQNHNQTLFPVLSFSPSHRPRPSIHGVPKILWLYWDQGMDHLKQIAESANESKYKADYGCIQAWKILHPTWDVRVLDRVQSERISPKYAELANIRNSASNQSKVCSVKLSDLLRLEVLTLYGGVYVDTSVCPMRPLDEYLGRLLASDGFYAPMLPAAHWKQSKIRNYQGCDRYPRSALSLSSSSNLVVQRTRAERDQLANSSRSLSTWFIAAQPNHILIKKWLQAYYERLMQVAMNPSCENACLCLPYFAVHCIFTLQRSEHAEIETSWIKFRNRVSPRTGYRQHKNKAGLCQQAQSHESETMVFFYLKNCFVVKKQYGAFRDFVRSPAYLEAVTKRAPAH